MATKKAPAVKMKTPAPVAGTFGSAVIQLQAQLDSVVKTLKKVNIKATSFEDQRQADSGQLMVALSLDDDRKGLQLIIDHQIEDTDLYDLKHLPKVEVLATSNKHRQVIILIEEAARSMTREVKFSNYAAEVVERAWQTNFGVSLPESAVFTVKNVKHREWEASDYPTGTKPTIGHGRWEHTATVTAKVPATKLYFLVGYDENHMFISCLPKKAESVDEAHRILLPKEVKGVKNYLRQGEFFFIPATEKELELIADADASTDDNYPLYLQKDGRDSDHEAQVVASVRKKNLLLDFCTGKVYNERHKQLFLNGWYKVVVNNEVPNPGDSTTWD